MKSNRASSTEVKTETYCRHGFHEWMFVDSSGEEVTEQAAENDDSVVQKCRHCGKPKVK